MEFLSGFSEHQRTAFNIHFYSSRLEQSQEQQHHVEVVFPEEMWIRHTLQKRRLVYRFHILTKTKQKHVTASVEINVFMAKDE